MEKFTENELVETIGGSGNVIRRDQAQAELLRRQIVELRKSNAITEKNNVVTERYNKAIVNLTMALFALAILQTLVPIWLSDLKQGVKALLSIGIMGFIALIFWYLFKEEKQKS